MPTPLETPLTVLLVDDHQILRQGLRSLLEQEPGLQVVAETGLVAEAVSLARMHRPRVVIMDIHLGDESGLDASRGILAENPEVKIVALSADPDPTLVVRALQIGVAAYLLKDDGREELRRALQAVLEGRLYLSPPLASAVLQHQILGQSAVLPKKPALTARERQLLQLIAAGQRSKEIAAQLGLEPKSVEVYRSRLLKKLGCASSVELARYAFREGLAEP